MTDLSKTIQAKSDQLNADDLFAGPINVTVTKVSKAAGDQPIAISYQGDEGKPYKPCKSMRRVLVHVWGSDGSKYVGRSMTLYRDPNVTFGGQAVGGIRISHMSNINGPVTMALTASKLSKRPYTVKPLKVEDVAKADPEVIKAGEEAAYQGTETYTEWLSMLPPQVKETVRAEHKRLSQIAVKADQALNADADDIQADVEQSEDNSYAEMAGAK